MSYPVKSLATTPKTQDYDVSDYDTGFDSDYEDFSQQGPSDEFVGGDTENSAPLSAQDLKKRIDDLLKQLSHNKDLSTADKQEVFNELNSLKTKANQAIFDPKKQSSLLPAIESQLGPVESVILGIPEDGENLPGGWGEEDTAPKEKPVKKSDLQDLLDALKKGERAPEEGSDLSADDCIKKLKDAVKNYSILHSDTANAAYNEVLDAVGGPKTAEEITADNYGGTPSKVDKNTLYFDGSKSDEKSYNLKAAGQGKTLILDDVDSVSIAPKNQSDPIAMSEEGNYVVVTVGSDTFKVSKDADIRIYSDQVSGKVDNSKGKITVGVDGKSEDKYIDPSQRNDLASKLKAALGKMGYAKLVSHSGHGGPMDTNDIDTSGFTYGVGWHDAGWVHAVFAPTDSTNEMYSKEVEDAKSVISAMSDAIGEKDSSKQKDLWSKATETLSTMITQCDTAGYTNNKAQLIFDVLYGELGESGLKTALENGLIPSDFSDKLSSALEADPTENNNIDNEIKNYQIGGPEWTHSTSSEFLKKHGKSSNSTPTTGN